jgi:putative RNA 2'-phosphotransferase
MKDYNLSKILSLVLRHKPEAMGIKLDGEGWTSIDYLINRINQVKKAGATDVTRAQFDNVVDTNNKKRFAVSDDGQRVRANQGHSIDVDLNLSPTAPPDELFHGTSLEVLFPIMGSGVSKGKRQYVHISADIPTATSVGQRHGTPVILRIDTKAMRDDGVNLFLADNDVWLTDFIDPKYISGVIDKNGKGYLISVEETVVNDADDDDDIFASMFAD